jgi:hypothetical protein
VGSWRVRDVGAHLTGITAYTAMLRGVPSPARSIDAIACRISADPAAHLLVTYGRAGPLGPALRGKITAGGRKPWLGLRLPRLFRQP